MLTCQFVPVLELPILCVLQAFVEYIAQYQILFVMTLALASEILLNILLINSIILFFLVIPAQGSILSTLFSIAWNLIQELCPSIEFSTRIVNTPQKIQCVSIKTS